MADYFRTKLTASQIQRMVSSSYTQHTPADTAYVNIKNYGLTDRGARTEWERITTEPGIFSRHGTGKYVSKIYDMYGVPVCGEGELSLTNMSGSFSSLITAGADGLAAYFGDAWSDPCSCAASLTSQPALSYAEQAAGLTGWKKIYLGSSFDSDSTPYTIQRVPGNIENIYTAKYSSWHDHKEGFLCDYSKTVNGKPVSVYGCTQETESSVNSYEYKSTVVPTDYKHTLDDLMNGVFFAKVIAANADGTFDTSYLTPSKSVDYVRFTGKHYDNTELISNDNIKWSGYRFMFDIFDESITYQANVTIGLFVPDGEEQAAKIIDTSKYDFEMLSVEQAAGNQVDYTCRLTANIGYIKEK